MNHVGKQRIVPVAELVIEQFGSVRKTAAALDIQPTDVSRWRRPRARKGCGGNIPSTLKEAILDLALQHGLDITAEDLVRGYRKVSA